DRHSSEAFDLVALLGQQMPEHFGISRARRRALPLGLGEPENDVEALEETPGSDRLRRPDRREHRNDLVDADGGDICLGDEAAMVLDTVAPFALHRRMLPT